MFGFGWTLKKKSIQPEWLRQVSAASASAQQLMNEQAKSFERENADQIAMDAVEGRPIPMSMRNQSFHNYGIQEVR